MSRSSEAAPLLVASLLVVAFVLLYLYPTTADDPEVGQALSFVEVHGLAPDEVCTRPFTIDAPYDRISLNHRFETAIRPRAALDDPAGTTHTATPSAQGLLLDIDRPALGNWTLRIWVEETPGVAAHIDRGEVFVLGFPRGEGEERPASICRGSLADG